MFEKRTSFARTLENPPHHRPTQISLRRSTRRKTMTCQEGEGSRRKGP